MSNGEDGFNISFGERSSREEDDDSPVEAQDGTPVEDDPPGEITPEGGGDGPDLGPQSGVGGDSGGTSSTAGGGAPVSAPGPSPGTGVSSGVSSGVSPEPSDSPPPEPEPEPEPVMRVEGTPTSQTEQLFEDPEVLGRHQIGSETPTPDNYYDTITSDLDPRLRSFYGENSIAPLIIMGQRTQREYDRRAADGESLLQRVTLADGTNLRGNPRIVDLVYLPVAAGRFEGVDSASDLTRLVAETTVLRSGEVDQYDTEAFQAFIDQQSDAQLLALSQSVLPAMAATFYGSAYGYSEDQLRAIAQITGRSVEYLNQQGYTQANIIDHGGFGGTEVVPVDADLARMWTEGGQGAGSMRQGFSTAHNLLRAEIAQREAEQLDAEALRANIEADVIARRERGDVTELSKTPGQLADEGVEARVGELGLAEQIYSGTAAQAPAEVSTLARAERGTQEDYQRLVPSISLSPNLVSVERAPESLPSGRTIERIRVGGLSITQLPSAINAPGRMNQRDLDPRSDQPIQVDSLSYQSPLSSQLDLETEGVVNVPTPISYSSSDPTRPHVALVSRRIVEMRGETAEDGSPLHTEEDIRRFASRMGSSLQEVEVFDELLLSEYSYVRGRVSGDEGDLTVAGRDRRINTLEGNIERYESEIEALEASRARVTGGSNVEAASENLEINRQIRDIESRIRSDRAILENLESQSQRVIPGEAGTFRTYTGVSQREGESQEDYLMRVAERRVVLMLNIAQTANMIEALTGVIGDGDSPPRAFGSSRAGIDYVQGLQQEFNAVPEDSGSSIFDAIRRYENHSWSTISPRANLTAYNNIYDRTGFVPPPRPRVPTMPPTTSPGYVTLLTDEGLPQWSHGDGRHWVAQAQDLVWNGDLVFGQRTAADGPDADPADFRRGYWVTREQDEILRTIYKDQALIDQMPLRREQLEERRRLQLLELQGVGGSR